MKPMARVIGWVLALLPLLGAGVVWLVLGWPQSLQPPTLRATLGEEGDPSGGSSLAFSPDGKTLASGSLHDGNIKLWDIATGANTRRLGGQEGDVTIQSVAFSPDGKLLASAVGVKNAGTALKLWDMTPGQHKARVLTVEESSIRSVVFSPNGKTLAWVNGEKAIEVWDVAGGNNTLRFEPERAVGVAFSPDGKRLASASLDATVKVWDLTSDKNAPEFEWKIEPWGTASCVAFTPDGTALAAGGATGLMSFGEGSGDLNLWDLSSGMDRASFKAQAHCQNIAAIAFSPDGKTLASGSCDGKVLFWDTSTGKLKATVGHHWNVDCVAFSPDGKILASGDEWGRIKLWDMPKWATRQNRDGRD
jgi:WD40 repeat protein